MSELRVFNDIERVEEAHGNPTAQWRLNGIESDRLIRSGSNMLELLRLSGPKTFVVE